MTTPLLAINHHECLYVGLNYMMIRSQDISCFLLLDRRWKRQKSAIKFLGEQFHDLIEHSKTRHINWKALGL